MGRIDKSYRRQPREILEHAPEVGLVHVPLLLRDAPYLALIPPGGVVGSVAADEERDVIVALLAFSLLGFVVFVLIGVLIVVGVAELLGEPGFVQDE